VTGQRARHSGRLLDPAPHRPRPAKLRCPAAARHFVRRSRLVRLLDDVDAPLMLVVAPAGAGKTSLVAGWAAEGSMPTAWLSLDESDRDGVQFWTDVVAALDAVAPGVCRRVPSAFRGPGAGVEAIDELLADLAAESPARSVLVIDDFHVVDQDDVALASVGRFVGGLPPWLHVVLMSRRVPSLPVDRMRSRGQLGEIGFAELRFSTAEASELMHHLAPSLTDDRIDAAVARADGWAASLQLAALAARSAEARAVPVATSAVDDLLVQDYLFHEVLAAEAPELLEVLAAASVVPRINAGLAQALTDRDDAGELLRVAEQRGLFVTRRGTSGWFDLHALVRSALLADLGSRAPARPAELHALAAQWFEDNGEVVVAIDQWLLADRPRDALRLLAANIAPLYDHGLEATTRRAIAAIPAHVGAGDFAAMADYAWSHLFVDRRRFIELVEQLMSWVERTAPPDAVRGQATLLQADAALLGGRFVEFGGLARRGLVELGDDCWEDHLGRLAWNGVARAIALAERWDDTAREIEDIEFVVTRDAERRLAFEGTRALGHALAGHPVDAIRVAAGARRAAEVSKMTILRAELGVAEGLAHREVGDRSRAIAELGVLAAEPTGTMLYCQVLASVELAHAHLDGGQLAAAEDAFTEVANRIEVESFGPGGRDWLSRAGTQLALAGHDPAGASTWAEQVTDPFWGPISRARVHLALADRSEALAMVNRSEPRCARHHVVRHLLLARSVPDREAATKHATAAVEIACEHGLMQTVASEGEEAVDLVERAAWHAPPEWLERLRRAVAEALPIPELDRVALVEPLSAREKAVLQFLPSRLTIPEIAAELYVSHNTLKFHLRTIYRKLAVNSRAEAVDAARKLRAV
jgi:LuxR family transcriptional regulator, maltose regulon positive regulatory protein